jgi:hypothetical protein
MLLNFLPQELVDKVYLYTDFYTAIRHIPQNKYVLKILFERDICKACRISGNINSIILRKILRMKFEEALVYFKNNRPYVRIRYDVFKYNKAGEIDMHSETNNMLIRVYQLKDEDLRNYTKCKRLLVRPWIRFPHPA